MSEPKRVRIIETSLADRFFHHGLTKFRVEQLADGIDYYTVAGFNSMKEAKAYRRKLLKEMNYGTTE